MLPKFTDHQLNIIRVEVMTRRLFLEENKTMYGDGWSKEDANELTSVKQIENKIVKYQQ